MLRAMVEMYGQASRFGAQKHVVLLVMEWLFGVRRFRRLENECWDVGAGGAEGGCCCSTAWPLRRYFTGRDAM